MLDAISDCDLVLDILYTFLRSLVSDESQIKILKSN